MRAGEMDINLYTNQYIHDHHINMLKHNLYPIKCSPHLNIPDGNEGPKH